jgi:protein O-mannosyl-transferase
MAGAPDDRWTARPALLAAVLAATVVCFSPALSSRKEFTNWDDPDYVTQQPLVRSVDLRAIFDPHHDVLLNYHPMTVLSLALNHRFAGDAVRPYAATNVGLHLLNTALVFLLVRGLTGWPAGIAALASLWWSIHPMHVESVAWISGRKDLVCGVFFLASCLAYLRYLRERRATSLAATFVLFVLACLGKATAVTLPLVLLLLDWFCARPRGAAMVVEKIPFFVVSLVIGVLAVRIQARFALGSPDAFTVVQRVAFASYGFVMYWVKLLVPVRLSAFYPYPAMGDAHGLPGLYRVMPLLALLGVTVVSAAVWATLRARFRVVLFGVAFFTLTVAPVLQLVSVGGAIMADRYSYVPYLGSVLVLAALARPLLENPRWRAAAAGALGVWTVALGIACHRRARVWTNSDVLWSDVIAKHPFRFEESSTGVRIVERGVTTAYENRGNYRREHGDIDGAARDYQVLVDARVPESGPYINMANIHGVRGEELLRQGGAPEAQAEFQKALEMYGLGLERGGDVFEAHLNRGITYVSMGQHERALDDFRQALAVQPTATGVLANVAWEELQLGRWDDCIADSTRLVARDPNDANGWFFRGASYRRSGRPADALSDLQRAVDIAPGLGAAWYELSLVHRERGDLPAALAAARRAQMAGHPLPPTSDGSAS